MNTDLNQYGAACRCLLRLRENQGEPGISDAAFIARFLPRFPEWHAQPGLTTPVTLLEIAREFGLADHIDSVRAYDDVLRAFRAGRGILVATDRAPEQREPVGGGPYVMLLVDADETGFSVWCPYPSGQSDVLPRAARVWWDRWQATALVLEPVVAADRTVSVTR